MAWGLIYKLKTFGLSGKLLTLLNSFLNGGFERVVFSGKSFEWKVIKAGVLQGSVLVPLLFLIYVNVIPGNLDSNVRLFADYVSLFGPPL